MKVDATGAHFGEAYGRANRQLLLAFVAVYDLVKPAVRHIVGYWL